MQEATIVERLRGLGRTEDDQTLIVSTKGNHTSILSKIDHEAASLIERQQQVIDLLMKAVEPFETYLKEKGRQEWMYDVDDIAPALESEFGENVRLTMGDLRRAREAKVEAERILSPREKTND